MKHSTAILPCAAMLVLSLAGCGGSDAKATLPSYTGGSSPSATTSAPTTIAPTPTATGPAPLVEHATYNYDGLKVTVNLPANIPKASRTSMLVASEFVQGFGRTFAQNKLDPSVKNRASAEVVKYVQTVVVPGAVQGIGSLDFTISEVHTAAGVSTTATICVDQSKVVQVRKDGSHFIDPSGKDYPRVKMTAAINRGMAGTRVTSVTSAQGTC